MKRKKGFQTYREKIHPPPFQNQLKCLEAYDKVVIYF